ncbi:hypothetical protein Pmani_001718 [Petrolisthes manimaculis]|uniref:Uncharacterized protein n=1 Tax=Petrolisthes manimaculis TaxID=1843537 RepID=A0AAE1QK35_9EUCA|nr:hypothetical protein Pmani_001718 [Petrolisthes manimaculis]
MTCGQRGEYGNEDDMWTKRHQTSPPTVPLDSDKMQCVNIFFILSIGFASAALAVGNPFLFYIEQLGDLEAASVRCSRLYLPNPEHQRVAIIDVQTQMELYSSASGTLHIFEDFIMKADFTINLIESDKQDARPQVECIIAPIYSICPEC